MTIRKKIKNFFIELFHIAQFIVSFLNNPKIHRIRVFLGWGLITIIPSIIIYINIQTWQQHVPGLEEIYKYLAVSNPNAKVNNNFLNMLVGTSILPLLFFLTNGLRGYHLLFSELLDFLFNRFKRKKFNDYILEFDSDLDDDNKKEIEKEFYSKIISFNLAKRFTGFLTLEITLIGWSLISYYLLGGSLSGLGLLGYIADDLLLGLNVFLVEAFYIIVEGYGEFPNLYHLNPFSNKTEIKTTV